MKKPELSFLESYLHFYQYDYSKKPTLKIGIVGKYINLEDAYLSLKNAINSAALAAGF